MIDGVPSTSTATLTGHLVVLARQSDSFSPVTRLVAKPRRMRPRAPLLDGFTESGNHSFWHIESGRGTDHGNRCHHSWRSAKSTHFARPALRVCGVAGCGGFGGEKKPETRSLGPARCVFCSGLDVLRRWWFEPDQRHPNRDWDKRCEFEFRHALVDRDALRSESQLNW